MEPIPRYLVSTIDALPATFKPEHYLELGHKRSRTFNPKNLLLTLIQLVGSTSHEGYDHALTKVFGLKNAPSKSAFSQFRSKISYKFIEHILSLTIKRIDRSRATFNNYIIYAVDGWQFTLPRTDSIVKSGYTGRATSHLKESYMPKAFLTHAFDVLSETTKSFALNSSPTELADALSFIPNFESNSITLYDRAFFSKSLCLSHFSSDNFFVARCQSKENKVVSEFFNDPLRFEGSMYYDTPKGKKKVWFIKVPNPKTGVPSVFATNLTESMRTHEILDKLYCLRWGAETSFFELSETMKMEQWHSKTFNGILQEFLTTMLIINLVKILKFFAQDKKPIDPMSVTYSKPNFKLLKNHFIQFCLDRGGKLVNLINDFKILIKRSTEKRKRRSRTHPREIRSPASPYPYNNTEWRWNKKYPLN